MAEKKDLKIGIIGIGVLGSVVEKFFKEKGHQVYCYDKFKKVGDTIGIGSIEEVNQADAIFICVPTPCDANRECDTSIVEEAIGYITGTQKIIIIKSTVIPGTTDRLQQKYPKNLLLFNPEFLTASRAYTDFINPVYQIVGYTPRSETKARDILGILPRARFNWVIPAIDAEAYKYFRNCFLPTKNSFCGEFLNLCRKAGINFDNIIKIAGHDPWIGPVHLDPTQDGHEGWKGLCLLKDTEALFNWAKKRGVNLSVLGAAIDYNSEKLASQGIKKDS